MKSMFESEKIRLSFIFTGGSTLFALSTHEVLSGGLGFAMAIFSGVASVFVYRLFVNLLEEVQQ